MAHVIRRVTKRLADAARRVDDVAVDALEIPNVVLGHAARFRFAIPLVVAAGVVVMAISEIGNRRLLTTFQEIQAANETRGLVRSLSAAVLDAETAQRGYLITERAPYLVPYRRALQELPVLLESARVATQHNPAARALVIGLGNDVNSKLSEMGATVALVDAGQVEAAKRIIDTDLGKRRMDRVRAGIGELDAIGQAQIDRLGEDWDAGHRQLRLLIAGAVLASVVLMMATLRLMRRTLDDGRSRMQSLAEEQVRLDRLVAERTEELSELANHLQTVREEEKASLARELHDELGAILTAARMDVAWASRRLDASPAEAHPRLQRALQYLDEGVALKRRIIEGMVPSVLHNLGLVPALEALCGEFSAGGGAHIVLEAGADLPEVTRTQALALYRIAQEALTNIRKHANATRVRLSLHAADGGLRLVVHDDGAGTDAAAPRKPGRHGVRGMRQRMVAMRGFLEIRSAPRSGTTVTAWIPVNPADPERVAAAAAPVSN